MKPTIQQQVAAYEKVIDLARGGSIDPFAQRNLSSCLYDGSDKAGKPNFCGVGGLFSPAQIADIKRRQLNSATPVGTLFRVIGSDNIVAATGLGKRALVGLQTVHDELVRQARRKLMTQPQTTAALISYCKARIRRITKAERGDESELREDRGHGHFGYRM